VDAFSGLSLLSVTMALVIFDFDGTLADTWRDIATALNRTLREAELPEAHDDQVRAWIGQGMRVLLERAVPDDVRSADRIAALGARFRRHYDVCCLDTTTLYPGIARCLDDLAGHTLAILSNKPGYFLDRIVAGLAIVDRFAAVVGGDALPAPKPDPGAVAHVLRAVGGAPRPLWMVGDSAIDIATGRAAGARTIGCAWGLRSVDELRAAAAEYVIDHPREIAGLIG
jgi:phosphoglycolate phosphatase